MTEQPAGEMLVYRREDGSPAIDLRLEGETLWLTQQQIADLFQTSRTNVVEHIAHIYDEGELEAESTCRSFRQVRQEGARQVAREIPHYNLDLIISVGYRVKSRLATQFRIWATERLREYLIKGFTMDDDRLKQNGGGTYWRELLERIRDIRSSEKVMYRQVLDLFATSIDYDPHTPEAREFFTVVQNKLHFGAHGHTAAEVIAERADAAKPHMGLTSFKGSRPVKSEVVTAKSHLTETELKQLNVLVSAYFDAAEFRAIRHEPTLMTDWVGHLDRVLAAMDAPLLEGAGRVSHQQAEAKAHAEYARFRAQADAEPSAVERDYFAALEQAQREIEGER